MNKKQNKFDINLSPVQLSHLFSGTIKNLVDMKVDVAKDGIRFLLILDCVFPDSALSIDTEPQSEDDLVDVLCSHMVVELADFIENLVRIKHVDGQTYRAISTVPIRLHNLPDLISALSELDASWASMENDLEEKEDIAKKIKGKNFVEGNDTVN